MTIKVTVVGGGLAGSEAAWQAAKRGINVHLVEMRPQLQTGAHQTDQLAELVCSNSLGSRLPDRASGILMSELERMGSLLLHCAKRVAVPAGSALAVDRNDFAKMVTGMLVSHSMITLMREEVKGIPDGITIIASGPLTSPALSSTLEELTGEEHLFFFDALAPIIESESINLDIAFKDSRYGRGSEEEGDYLNCPFKKEEYDRFVEALMAAERIRLRSFETAIQNGVRAGMSRFFEGCLPVEIIAERGQMALAFGPMKPVGLRDPRSGKQPYAVVQLRQEDLMGDGYNMVGFQTNLTYSEQQRIFRLIPGLEQANFIRYGQMHRNTFILSPKHLLPTLQYRQRSDLLFAGQLIGVEGYLGNIGTGLLAGINAARMVMGKELLELPRSTMLGALCHYVTHADSERFQPMKANLGILPPFEDSIRRNRRERARAHAQRSSESIAQILHDSGEDCT